MRIGTIDLNKLRGVKDKFVADEAKASAKKAKQENFERAKD